jgi:hypothetical protein
MLEEELIKTGYRYSDNEDGTFDVCYDHNQDAFFSPLNGYHVATVKEDDELWFVDTNETKWWCYADFHDEELCRVLGVKDLTGCTLVKQPSHGAWISKDDIGHL